MSILNKLKEIWSGINYGFYVDTTGELRFSDILVQEHIDLSFIKQGDVVALIGDINPHTIFTLLRLIDLNAVIVPLTNETANDHEYFFDSALVDVVINNGKIFRRLHGKQHKLLNYLKDAGKGGLILFTTGTTGRPKAILHNIEFFLKRFETPRPTYKTINFLLFDHIGGLNTLFHTLFNKGVIVAPESRTVQSILKTCFDYNVELLPTTPTFLRLMLLSEAVPRDVPPSLKVITYGTERMDQPTLSKLCSLLPSIDFRQTYGMSELGILRIKSESRESLYMQIGGEGVETRVNNNILAIRSESRMLGYLNAESPFDSEGWYDTKDVVDVKGNYFKIVGRTGDVINVAGLKFMAADVERVVLDHPGIALAKVLPRDNPITGQHVELIITPKDGVNLSYDDIKNFLITRLQKHMMPRKIVFDKIKINHRFKSR